MTAQGLVGGYLSEGVYTYKGIPYAKADRFMPPEPPDSWGDGVRSSRAYGPVCPQPQRDGWKNDEQAFAFGWDDGYAGEDCLRLNIWTRGIADGARRPVMVWIHGGGYSTGSSQELPCYDGTNLARNHDVVVVSVNHRLNVLGFLDLSYYGEKYADSGNVGLLDLVAALRWVNTNIEAFGGDPSNVTLFGQSGGGGKISALLATPSAAGLFHKAIIQSGPALRVMENKYSRRIGKATIEELGIDPLQVDKIKDVPYDELVAAGERAIARVRAEIPGGEVPLGFGWAPVVDGKTLPSHPFYPNAPQQSRDIPLLIGTTLHEFTVSAYVPMMRTASQEQAVEFMRLRFGQRTDDLVEAFGKAYPGYKPKDLIDTDMLLRPIAIEQADIKTAQGGAPVYMYLFAWESPVLDTLYRSTHCLDIPFVTDNSSRHNTLTGGGPAADALAEKMSAAWVSFARTGNPNTPLLPHWDAYTTGGKATMIFDNQCRLSYGHDRELMEIAMDFPLNGF